MSIEARRGCGFRKVGGLYLVSGALGEACHRLPHRLDVCPCCGAGIKQTRGWTWVDGNKLFEPPCGIRTTATLPLKIISDPHCSRCPVCSGRLGRCGLLWIGERFYPTPEHFTREAVVAGISRRIHAIPKGFALGDTWVLLAHPRACSDSDRKAPGIFQVFRPQRIEQIVTESQSRDAAAMDALSKRGITPVVVPDDDHDHRGSVHDDKVVPLFDE